MNEATASLHHNPLQSFVEPAVAALFLYAYQAASGNNQVLLPWPRWAMVVSAANIANESHTWQLEAQQFEWNMCAWSVVHAHLDYCHACGRV